MKTFLLLLLALSCSHAPIPTVPTPDNSSIEVRPVDVQSSEQNPYLTVTSCTNCTPTQFDRIREATAKLNNVVVGQCFKDEVLKYKFLSGWTLGKTNQQIFDSLIVADVKIQTEMYYTLKTVLGYTLPGQMKEWINRRYLMTWSACDLASLLAHETSHKIGYSHQFNNVSGRDNTVPYALNWIVNKCCK